MTPPLLLSTLTIFAVATLSGCNAAKMTQYTFNASDFCAMKVIMRCFTLSKMGLPRQTCGAQNIFELAKKGVGNRHRCMQATKITKWLQTTQIDTDALRNEVVTDCGAFMQINQCVDPYKEHCRQVFQVFGLNMFLQQWNYICDYKMYPRLEKHILCKREMPESANEECKKFSSVLGIDFENSTVSANMTDADCIKYKLILGCRTKAMLTSCTKGHGILSANFLLDFFNIQAESVGSRCLLNNESDPAKLASLYEKYVTELVKQSGEITTNLKTTTTTTLKVVTTTTPTTTTSTIMTTTQKSAPTTTLKIVKFKVPLYADNIVMPGTNELDDFQYDAILRGEEDDGANGSSSTNARNYYYLSLAAFSFVFHSILIIII